MIAITENDLKEIASAVGYPAIPLDLLELTEDAIKQFSVAPALRLYYRAFPIVVRESVMVNSSFEIDFPDEYVFGVKDARITVANRSTVGHPTSNPFVNSMMYSHTGSKYGTDYRDRQSLMLEFSGAKSAIDTFSTKKINVDMTNRKVIGYSNVMGELIIEWAKYSDDFSDVPFIRKTEVIAVAQGFLCEHLNVIRGQAMLNQGVDFNENIFQDKINRANDIKEKWLNRTKVVILRG